MGKSRAAVVRLFAVSLVTALAPQTSTALQLHWSTGATSLNFTSATRCTLVVQADALEHTLPSTWRLVWVARDGSIQPLAIDPVAACQGTIAQAATVLPPSTPADSAASLATAIFCSAAGDKASTAYYLLDLPPGSSGKLKVAALDTTALIPRVVQSSEVTFNGGVPDAYPPLILSASSHHPGIPLTITITGAGLAQVDSAAVITPTSSWPLQIVTRDDSTVIAIAAVPEPLPSSILQLSVPGGGTATGVLPADEVLAADFTAAAFCPFRSCYFIDPNPAVYPKDFAFIYNTVPNPWRGMFHLYYTRNHRYLDPDLTQMAFGHTWSRDLRNWSIPDTTLEFPRGTVGWDKLHVWAPTIVQQSGTSYMFYTGVDSAGNQSIGYATTGLIDTSNTMWNRQRVSIFTPDSTNWAYQQRPWEFRDPFVMADPDSVGRFLMFYVASHRDGTHEFAVGLARNRAGTMARWIDLGFYRSTNQTNSGNGFTVESPHVFPDSVHAHPDSSGQATWRLFFSHGIDSKIDSTIRF